MGSCCTSDACTRFRLVPTTGAECAPSIRNGVSGCQREQEQGRRPFAIDRNLENVSEGVVRSPALLGSRNSGGHRRSLSAFTAQTVVQLLDGDQIISATRRPSSSRAARIRHKTEFRTASLPESAPVRPFARENLWPRRANGVRWAPSLPLEALRVIVSWRHSARSPGRTKTLCRS